MKKFLWSLLVSSFLLTPTAFAAGEPLPQVAPLSPQYLRWKAEQEAVKKSGNALKKSSGAGDEGRYLTGYIPETIDWSHLASNPPRLTPDMRGLDRAWDDPLPRTYDLRNQNWLPPVRDQDQFGTCWAFAATGALESNAISKGIANTGTDLSEFFLAYFAYGDNRDGKTFPRQAVAAHEDPILDQGGNASRAIAFMSRQGSINEATLPYPPRNPPNCKSRYTNPPLQPCTYDPPEGVPEDYAPTFQLQAAYRLADVNAPTWNANRWNANLNAANQVTLKKMIREYGAVQISYYAGGGAYSPDGSTTSYFDNGDHECGTYTDGRVVPPEECVKLNTNHAVLAVGWNDDYSRMNFDEGSRPTSDGAWLVRNSWGTGWGDGGYFWMSYEQYVGSATVYIAEADSGLTHRGYDDLGYNVGSRGYSNYETAWSANVFQAQGDETVQEIAFYTTDNNVQYEAYVYDLGTGNTAPASPVAGDLLTPSPASGSFDYAGYHRVALPQPADVGAGHWFSVVVKMTLLSTSSPCDGNNVCPVALEGGSSALITPDVSWLSYDRDAGWSKITGANATIKAFTSPQVPEPVISTDTPLPEGTVGEAYSVQLAATGGEGFTWSQDGGSLPGGLTLSPAGLISGTPEAAGVFGFTAKVTNSANRSATKQLSITIKEPAAVAPTITTASLPNGKLEQAYNETLAAEGTTPITWTKTAGNLPGGLSLDASTGTISGTPTATGTFNFTVKASNEAGDSDPKALTITVDGIAPVVTTDTLPDGTVGTAYNAPLAATGTAPITWTKASGTLPAGLDISGAAITGTPTQAGAFNFTLKASNEWGESDPKALTITITDAAVAPTITTTTLPDATIGAAYSQTLAADGTAPITWAVQGNLPEGLSLDADTGTISGTPTATGTFTFTVTASNSAGNSDPKTLTIAVKGIAPAITTATLPGGTVGTAYNAPLAATGTGPFTWSLANGALPTGLTLSGGSISGTPTQAGTFNFTVQASNEWGESAPKALTITITDAAVAPTITTTTLPDATIGAAYSQALAADGTAPITWAVQGNLPPGLRLDGSAISGTPTATGTFTFTVTASNSAGNSDPKTLTITVKGIAPAITTSSLPGGTVGTAYNTPLEATGTAPIAWQVNGLPPGLSLSGSSITGTPTQAGTFPVTLTASNEWGSVSANLSITIADAPPQPVAPAITTTTLPNGMVGTGYNAPLSAEGSTPINWAATGLPEGLQISGAAITGTPTVWGTFNVTLTATNNVGSVSKTLTLKVGALPAITTAALPSGRVGTAYGATLFATGPTPIAWQVNGLPPGLAHSGNIISGTPMQAGTFPVTLTASNEWGTATANLTITIADAPPQPVAPTITTDAALRGGEVGVLYQTRLQATGAAPITWSLASGTLPAGLTLYSNGVLRGWPTAPGTYSFTAKATNAQGSATRTFTISVAGALTITTTSLPNGKIGTLYQTRLEASSDTIPVIWTVQGTLPAGLTIYSNGVLRGRPTAAGTYSFTVRATNAKGYDEKAFTVTVTR